MGGTILGSSRGPQPVPVMVDYLVSLGVSMLFTLGGDGTLKGAQAIQEEILKRGLHIAVIGLPKVGVFLHNFDLVPDMTFRRLTMISLISAKRLVLIQPCQCLKLQLKQLMRKREVL